MRRLRLAALIACALLIAPLSATAQQTIPVAGPKTATYTANGQSNVWSCTSGQSSFQLHVPTGLTGTLTISVSQNAAGPFVSPPWAFTPGSSTYTTAVANSGDITVALGSNLYVQVATTAYTSGSVTVTGTCSAAQVNPPANIPLVSGNVATSLQTGTTQNSTGNGQWDLRCDKSAPINLSASGMTELVALTTGKAVHVCGFFLSSNIASPGVTAQFFYGTASCGGASAPSTQQLTGPISFPSPGFGFSFPAIAPQFTTPASDDVCINVSGTMSANGVGGLLTYGVW